VRNVVNLNHHCPPLEGAYVTTVKARAKERREFERK
jgi:hypothetical protein